MTKPVKYPKPTLIKGGLAVDDRGVVSFVNDFDFKEVKRFYQVENHKKETVRAFHGHKKEAKYVFVSSGSALIYTVKLDNITAPKKTSKPVKFVLSSKSPSILYIPPMYVNGFKPLEKNTKIIFFSTSTLKDSEQTDDYRYPWDYWGKDIWEVENR